MIITEMDEWRDYRWNHETVVRLSIQDDRGLRVLTADRTVNSTELEMIHHRGLTDHFVLLSVPDGGAQQTLDLVVGEIRILPL